MDNMNKNHFRIKSKKFYLVSIMVITILIQYLSFMMFKNTLNTEAAIRTVSIETIICLVVYLLTWKRLSDELLCPYTVFLLVLFIFTCGQTIGWVFNLDMGTTDLLQRFDAGMNNSRVLDGLIYSSISLSFFHTGAIMSSKVLNFKIWYSSEEVIKGIKRFILPMMIVVVPCYLFNTIKEIMIVSSMGYLGVYVAEQSVVSRYVGYISDYMMPCLLLLLIANKDNKIKRNIIFIAMLAVLFISIYSGGRSDFAMGLFAIMLLYHVYIKKIDWKRALLLVAIGYFVMILFVSVAQIREDAGRGISEYFALFGDNSSTALGAIVGELGWNLSSIAWVQMLVPSTEGFRYGLSYLVSLIVWIPSFLFGGDATNPVNLYGNLASWLQKALNKPYGPGFTMVAESYMNFGHFGVIAMALEGYLIARILARVSNKNANNDLYHSIWQIIIVMVIMKPLVRSSTTAAFHYVFYVLLPLWFLFKYNIMKVRSGNNAKSN